MTSHRDRGASPHFQAALDQLYSGYMRKRHFVEGLADRDYKNPHHILDIARALQIAPPPQRTLKITGSKGKGTTSRLIDFYLRKHEGARTPIGLFVSPEEFEHTDRMKVDGEEISQAEFVDLYDEIRPQLDVAERALGATEYLSPFGIFFLIALKWFQRRSVGWWVLETGRGAAHDEVGVLPAATSVITSILFEHPGHLGPTLRDIAQQKLAIADASQCTIASHQTLQTLEHCALSAPYNVAIEADLPLRASVPRWLALDDRLARQAVAAAAQADDEVLLAHDISGVSAAWGKAVREGRDIYYDALINLDSLDRAWFERTFTPQHTLILCSLPDDKDRDRLLSFVEKLPGIALAEIILTGKRGYLSYEQAEQRAERLAGRIHYEDVAGFTALLNQQIALTSPDKIYCFGTHTYVRLVKRALLQR